MRILIFLHGTVIMHKSGLGVSREEKTKQVERGDLSVRQYENYVPVGKVVEKLKSWEVQEAEIAYLSSNTQNEDLKKDKLVLKKYDFPAGELYYRREGEEYKDVIERIPTPDVLIEDDCKSIGGEKEMTYTFLKPELKKKIKLFKVKEFEGIDDLPNRLERLI